MNRRNFLRTGGLLSLPLLSHNPLSAKLNRHLSQLVNPELDRVLVLVRLNGGNDGLNTLVPLDQFANLMANRANVMIPENQLLGIEDDLAFHPSAGGFQQLYLDGLLSAVQGVAYPDQNRSHFRSTDIWTSASEANEVINTGWLGRYFQNDYPEFPEGYPNDDFPHPFAIAVGSQVSQTCQGLGTNFSMAVTDPFNLQALAGGDDTPLPDNAYGDELDFLRTSIAQANAYGQVVQDIAEQGNSLVEYPDTRFARDLRNVAYLISGGLGTSVYVVSLGGFDTHANQVVVGETNTGEHAELMATLSGALAAFQADMQAQGLEERVLTMTFSEFGRRIRSNESFGTDHGTAAPLFLMGPCVQAGILGENPEIPEEAEIPEGVPMQYDFRDIYGTVFEDWFQLEPTDVVDILGHDYVHLPILAGCQGPSSVEDNPIQDLQARLWPNPTSGLARISFTLEATGPVSMAVSNTEGRLVIQGFERTLQAGQHEFPLDLGGLPSGPYFVRLQAGRSVTAQRILKR
ncbi:MAG: DUF1501 domain-containing protein [Bacteroidota bacterium]